MIKSWFKACPESITETILGHTQNLLIKTLSIILFSKITLVSGILLYTLGIIAFIPSVIYGKSAQNKINEYIKEKNRINLDIILETIRYIFMDEEKKVLEFFRNNNIFAVA